MMHRPASWNATAAYRLGVYWQSSGDFERAEAAYQAVLTEIDRHAPTLFNLSVTQIRLGQSSRALRTMDRLAQVTDCGIPADGEAEKWKEWSAVGCSVAYNRALACRYRNDDDGARAWSLSLARRLLTPHDGTRAWKKSRRADRQTLDRLRWSALMLHASICVTKLEPPGLAELHAGALRDHSAIARALDDELDGIGGELDPAQRDRLRQERLRDALAEPSVAKHLEWYVRLRAGEDVRTRYNLACYVSRLSKAANDPETASELRQRGIDHATFALRDHRLAAWADQDPALTPLKRHDEWSRLVAGAAAAAPAERATGTVDSAEPSATVQREAPAETDRRVLIDQLGVLLDEVRVPLSSSTRRRTDQLAVRAESLSDDAFQRELTALVASVHDSLTCYARERAATAALPLTLERWFDGDDPRYVVAEVDTDYIPDLPLGAEVTHWNGVAIGTAVEAQTGLIGATTADVRSARAVALLTHWPVDLLGPPSTDVVTLRCRSDGAVHEVRLRRSRTTRSRHEGHLLSIDRLADAVRRSRAELLPRTPWNGSRRLAGIVDSRAIPDEEGYGQLRLLSFDVEDADTFVDEVAHVVLRLPFEGLVIDLRGNSGGRIDAAERLLQLFTPHDVDPQRLQARATAVMARVARASEALATWRAPIETALSDGHELTEPFELALLHRDSCNRVGQIYHGPVSVIVDALTGGAADFFIAGFVGHGIGSITSIDDPLGNPPLPTESWSHAMLHGLLPGHPFDALPAEVAFHVPVRRAYRNRREDAEPYRHRRTLADIVDDDQDLLVAMVSRLAPIPARVLRPELELVSGKRIEGEVRTQALRRLRISVDNRECEYLTTLEDGTHRIKVAVTGPGPHEVELRGEGPSGDVLARRRVTLGGA